jgi:soluble lytic murein transglycosylase
VAAIIKNESTFNPEARSKVGAVGLMQVLPSTGDFVSRFSGIARSSQTPLNDPVHNIRIGLAYLAYLRSMFRNDHQKMLIAYNWGPENYRRSQRGLSTVPESSRTYARKILAHYRDSQRVFQSLAPRYRHFDLERAWAKNASPSIKQDSLPSVG